MRTLYIIIGVVAMITSILVWIGIKELSQFSAACYAFCCGCMIIAEGLRGGK